MKFNKGDILNRDEMKKSIEPHLENGADYDNAVESEKLWILLTVDTGAESLLFFSLETTLLRYFLTYKSSSPHLAFLWSKLLKM
jgi:hypothetical protein